MSIMVSTVQQIPYRVKVTNLVSYLMPKHLKRVLLLASLYRHITRCEYEELRKLNKDMLLCRNTEALFYPSKMSGVLWGGDVLAFRETQEAIVELSHHLIHRIPKGLHYAEQSVMLRDLCSVLNLAMKVA